MLSSALTLCSTSSPPLRNFTPLKPSRILKLRNPVLLLERRPKGVAFSIDDQDKSFDPSVFEFRDWALILNSSLPQLPPQVAVAVQCRSWMIIVVGIHLIEAPVLHPTSEGLFNFVIGWTFMFAPLLYTDRRRDRYKGSLDVLWGFQMFLTNREESMELQYAFQAVKDFL
ncbi:UNVERIFIED_CONTAM: hypothetical protein Sangu_0139300 [Sesamum angustifolium]|uniref:Uncharacterized protein n=1 Tax=Sesamum angustifolium TaxID=2727405 RepID=A0AAW2RKG3_9LAMI